MWEKDKQLLRAFRECWANVDTQLKDKEEVDVTSVCIEETEALTTYTIGMINYYKGKQNSSLSAAKQNLYTPKIPYHQNL